MSQEYINRLLVREDTQSPESALSLHRNGYDVKGQVISEINLPEHGRSLIFGEQGSGKTYILSKVRMNLPKPKGIYIDLERDLGTYPFESLCYRFDEEHNTVVLLDSFDKAAQKHGAFELINDIASFLKKYKTIIESLIIASRKYIWESDFKEKLGITNVWNADCLDLGTYQEFFDDPKIYRKFLDKTRELGIRDLLRRPLEGFNLARKFSVGSPLPRSKLEFLKEQANLLLTSREVGTPREELENIAGQLALLDTFCGITIDKKTFHIVGKPKAALEDLFRTSLLQKRGDGFFFAHDAYREYLAASAIKSLNISKQRFLLMGKGIHPYYRGIAALLAAQNDSFADLLFETDVLTAYMNENGWTGKQSTEFLENFFNWIITEEKLPWWNIPPRDEPFDLYLKYHRPENPSEFLKPYLTSESYVARLWGVTAAKAWHPLPKLNSLLLQIAKSPLEQSVVRRVALESLDLSKLSSWKKEIKPLFEDADDQVRGEAIEQIRKFFNPEPEEILPAFFKARGQTKILGGLTVEAMRYGDTLSKSQLAKAIKFIEKEWQRFEDINDRGGLWEGLTEGIAKGAKAHQITELNGPIFAEVLSSKREGIDPTFFVTKKNLRGTWEWLYQVRDEQRYDDGWSVRQSLMYYGGLQLIEALKGFSPKNERQESDLGLTLHRLYYTYPNQNTFNFIKKHFPKQAASINVNAKPFRQSVKKKIEKDDIKTQAVDILNSSEKLWGKAVLLVQMGYKMAPEEVGKNQFNPLLEKTSWLLNQVPKYVRVRILETFSLGVNEVELKIRRNSDKSWSVSNRYSRELEVALKIALLNGYTFPLEKYLEFVKVHGLWSGEESEFRTHLLDLVLQKDLQLWKRIIKSFLEGDTFTSLNGVIDYLLSIEDPKLRKMYFTRAVERIKKFEYENLVELEALLGYVRTFSLKTHLNLLSDIYQSLPKVVKTHREGTKTNPLWHKPEDVERLEGFWQGTLLSLGIMYGEKWAWEEVKKRLNKSELIIYNSRHSEFSPFEAKTLHASILGKWYLDILNREATLEKSDDDSVEWQSSDDMSFKLSDTRRAIREAISKLGQDESLRLIKSIQAKKGLSLSTRLTLSYDRLELERWQEPEKWEPSTLLNFYRDAANYPIRNEYQLFEIAIEGFESVGASLKEGEGVQGFWNVQRKKNEITEAKPKIEPDVQNTLWGLLHSRFEALAIVAIREKLIQNNRADFWLEVPVEGMSKNIKVPIELKLAGEGRLSKESWLIEPIEKQLLQKYLLPHNLNYGIFVVIWFKNTMYPYPKEWSKESLLNKLNAKARKVKEELGVTVKPIILDVSNSF